MNHTVPLTTRGLARPSASAVEGFADALRAEWTKLRTTPGSAWILAGIGMLTIAVSAGVAAAAKCPVGGACASDTTKISLTGTEVGQALVAVLAVLVITGEYSTGMIRTTFTAMPRRSVVLAAKAAVLACVVLPAAAIAVAGSLAAGRLVLPGNGFTAARGYALVSLAHGPTVRAAVGTVLYLLLVGLLSLAIATIVRDSAVATGTVLALLYVVPIAVLFLGADPTWQHRLERYSPTNAGLAVEDTTGLRHLPIGPWGGLGVFALWAATALLTAALALRLRDTSRSATASCACARYYLSGVIKDSRFTLCHYVDIGSVSGRHGRCRAGQGRYGDAKSHDCGNDKSSPDSHDASIANPEVSDQVVSTANGSAAPASPDWLWLLKGIVTRSSAIL